MKCVYCIFYQNELVYTTRSFNINFECGPQVEKGWARLAYDMVSDLKKEYINK
jgi:hypothetical protein